MKPVFIHALHDERALPLSDRHAVEAVIQVELLSPLNQLSLDLCSEIIQTLLPFRIAVLDRSIP